MPIEVREISANETLLIRSAILRPGMPLDAVQFPGDELETTVHFGAFADSQHVGVASIYLATLPEQPEVIGAWQLRGMATVPEVRGQGAGRTLLLASIAKAREKGGNLLWCNARKGAVEFYQRYGLEVIGDEFDIAEVGPHFRMWIRL